MTKTTQIVLVHAEDSSLKEKKDGSENSPANWTFASNNQRMSARIPLIINKCSRAQ